MSWEKVLNVADEAVKKGDFKKAIHALQEQKKNHSAFDNVDLALRYARLQRRLGQPMQALHALNRISSSEKSDDSFAIEKAGSLMDLGSARLAQELLLSLPSKHAEAHMQLGMAAQSLWNIEEATKHFERALELFEPNSYFSKVALVNILSVSLHMTPAHEWMERAKKLLNTLGDEKDLLLKQWAMQLVELQKFFIHFPKSFDESVFKLPESLDSNSRLGLIIRKWDYLQKLCKSKSSQKELTQLKNDIKKNHGFEIQRDIDLMQAFILKDPNKLKEVLAKTASPGYYAHAQRVAKRMGLSALMPNATDFYIQESPIKESKLVSLTESIKDLNGAQNLLPQTESRLLFAIGKDAYKPVTLLSCFELVYPDEHELDLDLAGQRLRKCLSRLRVHLEELKSGLDLKSENNLLSLDTSQTHWSLQRRVA